MGSVIILGDLTHCLPQGILDYFDIVDYSDMGSYYIISLE